MLTIDGKRYMYSRGHWFNTGGFILTPEGPERHRGRETVTAPRDWAALQASLANDLLVFRYNAEVVAKCPVRTNRGRVHGVRVGFAGHQTTVAVKDFTLRVVGGEGAPLTGVPGRPKPAGAGGHHEGGKPPAPPDDF